LADGKVIAEGPMPTMLASQQPWQRAYFHGKRARLASSALARRFGARGVTAENEGAGSPGQA
jgi:ABC-type transporter Mla maintaining outer membrane lipid asymmetry ATPase subunit MlaF